MNREEYWRILFYFEAAFQDFPVIFRHLKSLRGQYSRFACKASATNWNKLVIVDIVVSFRTKNKSIKNSTLNIEIGWAFTEQETLSFYNVCCRVLYKPMRVVKQQNMQMLSDCFNCNARQNVEKLWVKIPLPGQICLSTFVTRVFKWRQYRCPAAYFV